MLLDEGILNEDLIKEIRKDAKAEVKAAIKFSEESPFPEVSAIKEDVYWEVDEKTEAGQTGLHFFN